MQLSLRAHNWLREKSGTDSPKLEHQWKDCFESLCTEVSEVVIHCHGAFDTVLKSHTDGEGAIEDLRKRLDRNWPTEKFGILVKEILTLLDQDLNVPVFRDRHLKKWRRYLNDLSEKDDLETKMIRLIERDVLNHLDEILPIDGRDIIALGIPQGPDVGIALRKARELHMQNRDLSREELMDLVRKSNLPENDEK
ncbi:MAG: hypothetical protein OXJ55_03220 [Caldilineaceae bacterium]|nr:hypothetical protein [Caldilineaceae bacterium]MDE0463249.1 hypothetical protein [Caldilineaceae bacterium]